MSFNIDNFISPTVKNLPPSGIRKFFDVAATMDNVISLGVGEPDFPTPMNAREKAIEVIKSGKTAYTSNAGTIELREAIANYLDTQFAVKYDAAKEIVVTVGGSEAVDLAFRTICNPGDEVLVAEPAFVSYKPCITLAGGVPVPVPTRFEDGFKVRTELLESYVTDKTKAIIINFPCNPTGAIMDKADLQELADFCIKHNLLVISDEIYAELTYGSKHVSIASLPNMKERTILVSGVSKAFAMTGWRIGYLCAPAEIIEALLKIHQYGIMCASTTGQAAALEAFKNSRPDVDKMIAEYDERRKFIVGRFKEMGLDIYEPKGAFYAFPSIQKTGLTSEEFCNKLLFDHKVAAVPGNAFGESGEGFIRCSYACSMENLKTAADRIEEFIKPLI